MFIVGSVCFLGTGLGFAFGGLRHVSRDTPEKVQAVIRKVGYEMEGLEKKLKARGRHVMRPKLV
jgi:uncharacterized membrane protein